MLVKNLCVFLYFLFQINIIFAQESEYTVPLPAEGEVVVMALTPQELKGRLPFQNFTDENSPGYCYAIEKLSYALITNVSFDPNQKRDSDQEIENKLNSALNENQSITLNGFKNHSDFFNEFQDITNPENPLYKIIKRTQKKEAPSFHLKKLSNIIMSRRFEKEMEERLLKSGAFKIGFGLRKYNDDHAISIIGMRNSPINGKEFFAVDSNHPNKVFILSLRKRILFKPYAQRFFDIILTGDTSLFYSVDTWYYNGMDYIEKKTDPLSFDNIKIYSNEFLEEILTKPPTIQPEVIELPSLISSTSNNWILGIYVLESENTQKNYAPTFYFNFQDTQAQKSLLDILNKNGQCTNYQVENSPLKIPDPDGNLRKMLEQIVPPEFCPQ